MTFDSFRILLSHLLYRFIKKDEFFIGLIKGRIESDKKIFLSLQIIG